MSKTLNFELETSDVFDWNRSCTSSVIVNQGGTSSGKTYSILQLLFLKAIEEPDSVITVVGQDIPNLKVGAIRDADSIVRSTPPIAQEIDSFNKSDRIYRFRNGSVIEFNSYDGEQDAKSGKRDYLFINEANGIPFPVYQQLALRTRKQTFIDYNPNEEFWVHDNIIPEQGTTLFISDHRHNPFLPDEVRRKIEALKDQDEEMWRVYARGLTGKIQGLIYRNYSIVEGIPVDAILISGGLDFGYTNDPTAFLNVYKFNGELYVDELIYEHALMNPDICKRFSDMSITKQQEIFADSAEPKSIAEIGADGWNINPVVKGPDSVRSGINALKKFKINITKSSTGIRKELKTYKWKVDKNGKMLNDPIDFMNHSLDALRYVALMRLMGQSPGRYAFI